MVSNGTTSGHRTILRPPEIPLLKLISWRQPLFIGDETRFGNATEPASCPLTAHLGLEARSGARVSSNVNGTTACASQVCGKTGARQIIEGGIEYGAYSWATYGWTSNSGLSLPSVPALPKQK